MSSPQPRVKNKTNNKNILEQPLLSEGDTRDDSIIKIQSTFRKFLLRKSIDTVVRFSPNTNLSKYSPKTYDCHSVKSKFSTNKSIYNPYNSQESGIDDSTISKLT